VLKITVPIYKQFTKGRGLNKKIVNTLIGLNWYRNVHYAVNDEVKKEYKESVLKQIKNYKPFDGKVKISFFVYLKSKRIDGGNVRSVIEKYVLDALVESNIIKNDTIEYIVEDKSVYLLDKENPRCVICIENVGNYILNT